MSGIYLHELLAEVAKARDLLKANCHANGGWPGADVMEAHDKLDRVLKSGPVFTRTADREQKGLD